MLEGLRILNVLLEGLFLVCLKRGEGPVMYSLNPWTLGTVCIGLFIWSRLVKVVLAHGLTCLQKLTVKFM